MEITWYGHSCFRMVERSVASIVTDPFDPKIGYGELKFNKTDIATISHDAPGHNFADSVKAEVVLASPGEYEIGGVFITGVAMYDRERSDRTSRNTVFVFDFGNISVCHLGDLDYVPVQSQIEALGPIDVLLAPVGGGAGLTSSQAVEVISLIEPGIVVPMHYDTPASKIKGLEGVDRFLKEMGLGTVAPQDTLKVSSTASLEETQVVVLNYEH